MLAGQSSRKELREREPWRCMVDNEQATREARAKNPLMTRQIPVHGGGVMRETRTSVSLSFSRKRRIPLAALEKAACGPDIAWSALAVAHLLGGVRRQRKEDDGASTVDTLVTLLLSKYRARIARNTRTKFSCSIPPPRKLFARICSAGVLSSAGLLLRFFLAHVRVVVP